MPCNLTRHVFLFLLLTTAGVFAARHHVFFWDTVQLGAKHAYFYSDENFSQILLPREIDSGHPPAFGMYLAACWKIFGQTLPVSHFAMLPFLWGIVWLLFRIGARLGSTHTTWMLTLLVFADPVFAAQALLVSPDIALVCFFLLGVWAVLEDKPYILALAVTGLGMISMRGMMTAASIFTWQHLSFAQQPGKWRLWPYIPGGLLAGSYLLFHYLQTGWIGYHPDSPWAPSFERVGASGILRNIVIITWRLLDFGRVFLWIAFAGLVWHLQKRQLWPSIKSNALFRQSLYLFIIAMLLLGIPLLFYRSISAHRYLLPVFLSLTMVFYATLVRILQAPGGGPAKGIFALAVGGLLCGSLWVYPPYIAQGWDASPAHLPYYGLRGQALHYIASERIPLEQVGTAFPEIGPLKYRDLSGREEGMKAKDLRSDRYVLWSNVMNDFSDAEREELQAHWKLRQHWRKGGVEVRLYEKEE